MPAGPQDLTMPFPLVLAVLLAVVALGSYAVRAHGRRRRRRSRSRDRALLRSFRLFIEGALTPAQLAHAAESAEEGSYWDALELLTVKLKRGQWIRVSRALAKARHASAERRALSDDSSWRRALAARRLGMLRSRPSWRALRRAMVKGPEMVTFAAATSLARYRDRAAMNWILTHDVAVAHRHRNALVALFRGFGRGGLPVLTRGLARGVRSARVELAMIDALGVSAYAPARMLLE
ncbi:MAG TPA: hypothetical protein VJY35_06625, partial [Candidatus Eisenbacteria bacterium]|nr:hypothetical protein [Candidatus Eisenbacteria bacterium]